MKVLANFAVVVGIVSMGVGIIVRIMERRVALGLTPSSFLEFSVACFLLTIAIEAISKK